MNKTLILGSMVGVLLTCGAVMLADSSQDRTQQPGQPTQGKVWIQNRGETEAVPVNIQNDTLAPPLRVQVTGIPTVTTGSGSVVQARTVRQPWEYRTVSISAGQDPATALNNAGGDGWDTTGVTVAEQGRTLVVMKRPR
jgi:hypothetical protein